MLAIVWHSLSLLLLVEGGVFLALAIAIRMGRKLRRQDG